MAIPEVLLNHGWGGYVCVKSAALADLLADLPGYSYRRGAMKPGAAHIAAARRLINDIGARAWNGAEYNAGRSNLRWKLMVAALWMRHPVWSWRTWTHSAKGEAWVIVPPHIFSDGEPP